MPPLARRVDGGTGVPAKRLQEEINKRLTLNLLIQGSAQHAFLTSHHLVRDELAGLNPDLLRLYDQIALAFIMQYWSGECVLVLGWPDRFWRRASRPGHPYAEHPLLSRHGLQLALAAKQRAIERSRGKGVSRIPLWFTLQSIKRMIQIMFKERAHRAALVALAKRTTREIWGVPYDMLDGQLTRFVAFGRLRPPKTAKAFIMRAGMVGYGGVLGSESRFRVVGKGWVWPILSHELVKGTVELICMHGLCGLDATTYEQVMEVADRVEHEPWMLQVGSELWRRLLPLLPIDRPVAEMVMHLARLPAQSLERVMLAVVEDQTLARKLLAELGTNGNAA